VLSKITFVLVLVFGVLTGRRELVERCKRVR